jgi:hypothetical protein
MSRPRKYEPRSKQLNLSLTERELASIEARAAALGMRPVHFGRALLLEANCAPEGAGRAPRNTQHRRSNFEHLIHAQLVRLGNNLNQMTRHLHRFGGPVPPDLEPLLIDIRAIIVRVPR